MKIGTLAASTDDEEAYCKLLKLTSAFRVYTARTDASLTN
jgi:hypothetical protein